MVLEDGQEGFFLSPSDGSSRVCKAWRVLNETLPLCCVIAQPSEKCEHRKPSWGWYFVLGHWFALANIIPSRMMTWFLGEQQILILQVLCPDFSVEYALPPNAKRWQNGDCSSYFLLPSLVTTKGSTLYVKMQRWARGKVVYIYFLSHVKYFWRLIFFSLQPDLCSFAKQFHSLNH